MSIKKTIEIEARVGKAEKDLEGVAKSVQNIDKNLEDVKSTSSDVAKGVKGIGTALKAAGIGLVIAAFAKLKEVFEQNQKVTDAFNIAFEGLSLAFNDLFNYLNANVGNILGYFKGLFSDPKQALSDFGDSIKANLIERFNSFLDTLGYLSSAVKKVFSGDFTGAMEDVKSAGKESLDVLTGVNNTFDKSVEAVTNTTKAIVDYTKSTIDSATAIVELNRKAKLGIAQNRIILEQKDREAEKLRQIRDDESKTIEERIEANNKLAAVLNEQERLMLANADAVIAAAQAQFDKNKNDENQIALLEAKAEREGILAQIEGFRSEQLMNVNSLNREKLDLLDEETQKELERKELLDGLAAEKELTDREKAEAELAQKEADALKELSDLEGSEAEKLRIQEFFKQQKKDLDTKLDKEELARKEALERQKLALTANTLGNLAQLLGENSAAGKAAAIAQAVINSYLGFTEVLSSESILPQPLASIEKIASAGTILASGLQTVKQITSVKTPTFGKAISTGGGGGGRSVSAPQAPSFNVVGASDTNQLAEAINGRDSQPIKAFVVSNEVTNAQALDRNIVESASLG
jgi:hypothetical protein